MGGSHDHQQRTHPVEPSRGPTALRRVRSGGIAPSRRPPGRHLPRRAARSLPRQRRDAGLQLDQPPAPPQALDVVAGLLGEGPALAWDVNHIPLPGLEQVLKPRMLRPGQPQSDAQGGLTGADAALAATGSLVLVSGSGRPRAASLLPPVHVAVLERARIVPDLESWFALQRQAGLDRWRAASHAIVISGPSRTADIAMTLIMGMHGPAELHIVIV
ncbi:MAG: lactate utilization protein [Chloroflexota bacterium]